MRLKKREFIELPRRITQLSLCIPFRQCGFSSSMFGVNLPRRDRRRTRSDGEEKGMNLEDKFLIPMGNSFG